MLNLIERKKLIDAAIKARKYAYAPYSDNFAVGAAVLTGDGTITGGCNVENGSFGATMCAERVAIFTAISNGHRDIRAVAVVADSTPLTPPCGMCLQVATEFGPGIEIIMADLHGHEETTMLENLLPRSFKFDGQRSEDRQARKTTNT